MKTLTFPTSHKTQLMDISVQVKEAVIKSGVKEGICVVYTPHTTGSVFLFENADQNLRRDLLASLSKIISNETKYAHVGPNGAAHLKSAYMGASVSIPVHDGRPMFGQWQGVFFGEFDGPRQSRDVIIKVIAG